MSKESDGQDHADEGTAKLPCSSGWRRLLHERGDLFTCPPTDALAHCISEDLRMGAGIAVLFKKRFGGLEELLAQKKQPGQCAVLRRAGRFVYYLVTKKKYNQKPTYDILRKSLVSMREHCLANGVNSISMPRIGCGLDKLKWKNVSSIISEVFQDTKISITVYTI
ncbi:O-acetyl-ADP-ribose deacetylase 1 isoform X2 [Sinocyclocheilus grahami]|uniref:O-acetyl-ADP-ribose deacetylase 1 isoform X2 n=1 Tax=Sinocyclocheilus grahami TaxID=75366 RepID=UPI0007AD51F0|nr:PREDICTED: O-acetyl-ADP-ribose deacetylase 1 isoform X2 [Sinocyclocheilus grahami]